MNRDNYYILLELDFDKPEEDKSIISEVIKTKQLEWSKKTIHPTVGQKYISYLEMIPEIERVLLNSEQTRRLEALMAQKITYSHLDKMIALISAKKYVELSEIQFLINEFRLSQKQIEKRIAVEIRGEKIKNSDLSTVYGIDLGTTYSCISYVDEEGKPVVVKNMEGELTTPSVVYFENENNVVVGKTAKESASLFPEQTVSFIKKFIGKPGFALDYYGYILTPPEISAYILKKLVGDAEKALDTKIMDVVITCPAYFSVCEREATKNAGIIAGLNVLSIIDEPVAAAIMYESTEDKDNEDKVVLVYDLGGATFDLTLIDMNKDGITVICSGGDANLGGRNWDDAIILYIAEQFQEATGVPADDLFDDMEMVQELTLKSEIAKKELTRKVKAIILLNFNGNKVRIEITRDKFNEITADLANKTMYLTRNMLTEAEAKGYKRFDELLLVGGSTRMPQIQEDVKKHFPDVEVKIFDPDEAVSKGASIYGYMMRYQQEQFKKIRGNRDKLYLDRNSDLNTDTLISVIYDYPINNLME